MLDRHITGKLEVGRAGKWRAAWIFPAAEDLLVRSARLGRLGGPPATSVPTRRAPYLTLASSASRNSIQIYLNSSSCKPIMSENNAVTFNWFRKFINGPMKFDKLSGSFTETVSKFCGIGHYFRYLPTKKGGKFRRKLQGVRAENGPAIGRVALGSWTRAKLANWKIWLLTTCSDLSSQWRGWLMGAVKQFVCIIFHLFLRKSCAPGRYLACRVECCYLRPAEKKARPPIHHVPNSGGHFGQVKWVDIYSSPVDRRIIMKRGNIFDPLECASVKMLMRAAPLCPPFPLCLQQKAATATLQAN